MKKIIIALLILIIYPICFNLNVNAEFYHDDISNTADELNIDTSGINDNLTPEVRDFIDEHDLTIDNTDEMVKITPKEVFAYVIDQFKLKLISPMKTLAILLAVILVCSVIDGMGDTIANKSTTQIYGIISVLVAVSLIIEPLTSCIFTVTGALNDGGVFMLGYIPVFASITASAGNVTSAVSYNMIVVMISEAAVQLASNFIMPALSICMALGIVEAINPNFSLSGITETIKKVSTFALSFIMTIFIGLLSIQSIVGVSADTLGVKAAKFMVSNCIPVVGGAIADAYSTVRSSLGLLRSGVGFFGIAAIFIMVIPPILEVVAMKLVFIAGEILVDLFGVSRLKVLMKNTSSILSISLSLLVCFSVMLIISTTILMMAGLNIS